MNTHEINIYNDKYWIELKGKHEHDTICPVIQDLRAHLLLSASGPSLILVLRLERSSLR